MIGVPVLSPKWIPGRGFMEAPESVSIQCDSLDDLANKLEDIVAGRLPDMVRLLTENPRAWV